MFGEVLRKVTGECEVWWFNRVANRGETALESLPGLVLGWMLSFRSCLPASLGAKAPTGSRSRPEIYLGSQWPMMMGHFQRIVAYFRL